MLAKQNSHRSSTESLPLRDFAAPHGERSRSPSPPAPNAPTLDRTDTVETLGPNPQEASNALLTNAEKHPHSISTKLHIRRFAHEANEAGSEQNIVKIILPRLVRCLISWCLIAGFYASLWAFKDRVISPRTKSAFDTITIGLSIAFGLNIASSLKGIALDLRWWILSAKKRPSREVELVLHLDSMTELLKLMYVAPRSSTIIPCLSWLSLNMLSQVGVAILGLTYSANPGVEDIYRRSGLNNVSVPNMSTFAPSTGRFTRDYLTESLAAHVLGNIGGSYNVSMLPKDPLSGKPWASNPADIWNGTDHWEYVFRDSAPTLASSGSSALSIYTDKIVNSTGSCKTPAYRINFGNVVATITFLEGNSMISLPSLDLGLESILYVTTPVLEFPERNTTCGPGCSNIKIVEPAAGPPAPGSFVGGDGFFVYDCNITVTSNHEDLSPLNAAVAAQAIALSGQIHTELANTSHPNNQYIAYNFGLTFGEAQNNSATGMASLISRFAIGVVAAAAQTNPSIIIQGGQPAQGVRITLDAAVFFHLILGLTAGLQLLLVVAAAFAVKGMVIPRESPLSEEEEIQNRFVIKSRNMF